MMSHSVDFIINQMAVYVSLINSLVHCFVCLWPNTMLPQLL